MLVYSKYGTSEKYVLGVLQMHEDLVLNGYEFVGNPKNGGH